MTETTRRGRTLMLPEEQIARINELARKSRSEGLTQAEKDEQTLLRTAYLAAFRAQFKDMLDHITIVEQEEKTIEKEEKALAREEKEIEKEAETLEKEAEVLEAELEN